MVKNGKIRHVLAITLVFILISFVFGSYQWVNASIISDVYQAVDQAVYNGEDNCTDLAVDESAYNSQEQYKALGIDNYEPNDSYLTAKDIFIDQSIHVTLHEDDQDWFKISIDRAGSLQVNFRNLPYENFIYYLYQLDEDDDLVRLFKVYIDWRDFSFIHSVLPGDYFLRFVEDEGSPIFFDIETDFIPFDYYEPNDIIEASREIFLNTQVEASIHSVYDKDWFKFTLPEDSKILTNFSVPNLIVKLFSSFDQREIVSEGLYNYDNTELQLSSGNYYMNINNNQDMPTLGSYSFQIDTSPVPRDRYETNNDPETATELELNQVINDNMIYVLGDVDWFVVDVPENGGLMTDFYQVPKELGLKWEIYRSDNYTEPIFSSTSPRESRKVTAGRYFLKISGMRQQVSHWGPDGRYKILITKGYFDQSFAFRLRLLPDDENEANDCPEDAVPVELNELVLSNTINATNDIDWFRVEVDRPGGLLIKLINMPENVARVEVFNELNMETSIFGSQYDSWNGGNFSHIYIGDVSSGTYFIKVGGNGNYFSSKEWAIKTSLIPWDSLEPNSKWQDAKELACGQKTSLSLHAPDDIDWIKINVPDEGALKITLENLHLMHDFIRIYLYHEANPYEPIFEKKAWEDIETSKKVGPGEYFIRIEMAGDRYIEEEFILGTSFIPDDFHEPNDSWKNSTPIITNQPITGNINASDDRDWFGFSLAEDFFTRFAFNDIPGSTVKLFMKANPVEPIVNETIYHYGQLEAHLSKGDYYLQVGDEGGSFSEESYNFYIDTTGYASAAQLQIITQDGSLTAGEQETIRINAVDSWGKIVNCGAMVQVQSSSSTMKFSKDNGATWSFSNVISIRLENGSAQFLAKDTRTADSLIISVIDQSLVDPLAPEETHVEVLPGELKNIIITSPKQTIPLNNTQQFAAVGYDTFGNIVSTTPSWQVIAGTGNGIISDSGLFKGIKEGTMVVRASSITAKGPVEGRADVVVLPPSGTHISIEPMESRVIAGDTVTVNIWANEIADLYGAQINISFDPDILEVLDEDTQSEGIQIQPGSFISGYIMENSADNSSGIIKYAISKQGNTSGSYGTGVLASIDFKTKAVGKRAIIANNLILSNSGLNLILDYALINGEVNIVYGGNLKGNVTSDILGKALSGVMVRLKDAPFMTFSQANGSYIFEDIPQGNYSAVFSKPGYLNRQVNNFMVESTEPMELPETIIYAGDICDDNLVDIYDLIVLSKAWGSKPQENNWNLRADLYQDQVIDVLDLVAMARNYGLSGDVPFQIKNAIINDISIIGGNYVLEVDVSGNIVSYAIGSCAVYLNNQPAMDYQFSLGDHIALVFCGGQELTEIRIWKK